MAKVTPSLLSLLQACITKQAIPERVKIVVCMCVAILAKFRNPAVPSASCDLHDYAKWACQQAS